MKRFLLLSMIFVTTIYAQEKTIVKSDSVIIGWFGGPAGKFTQINNEQAFFAGGRAGVVLNHHIALGIGGYGLVNEIEANELVNGSRHNINFGYGGVEVEYIHNWREIVHYSFALLVGGGSVSYRKNNIEGVRRGDDQVFVVEPTASLEFNFTKYFRVNLGAGYRFVSKLFFGDLSSNDLDGFTSTLTLKFGDF